MLSKIALSFVSGLGCKSYRQLMEIYNSPEEVFALSHSELTNIFGKHKSIITAIEQKSTFARAEEELRFCEKHHIKPLYFTDREYPQRLNRAGCEDTPPLLYYMGSADLNTERTISVVGTRKATEIGKENTRKLIDDLQHENILVVSGLAYGIDTQAHTTATEHNIPTIGVVAHGLDQLYPPQNRNLAKTMVQTEGGLLTEYPSQTRINPSYFPARNRIIAAMSDAIIVVEASEKGGALITANLGNGYHRDVFAFPGRVDDKYSTGCNRIISNGRAVLIQNADDVFSLMNWSRKNNAQAQQTTMVLDLTPDQTKIHTILSQHGPMAIEEIMEHTSLSLPKIAAALLDMELKNICRCLPGKTYKLN